MKSHPQIPQAVRLWPWSVGSRCVSLLPAQQFSLQPAVGMPGLHKPSWNPPAWIFGPVWTLLYVMMAVAAWLVWREGGWKAQGRALGWFLLQWLLNALWTPLFFGMHRARSGVRGNHRALVGAGGDPEVVLAGEEGRRRFAGSLSGVGKLCGSAELHHLANEPLNRRPSLSHQAPLADPATHPEHLKLLEDWLRSYRPEDLFDEQGRLKPELAELAPKGERRMGANPPTPTVACCSATCGCRISATMRSMCPRPGCSASATRMYSGVSCAMWRS